MHQLPRRPPPGAVLAAIAVVLIAAQGATSSLTAQAGQIEAAVLPLPEEERAGATVLGYRDGELVTLRQGTGRFECLADDPSGEGFQVACYHESLVAYMSRGRELRAQGVAGQESIARRWEEIDSGDLSFPKQPAALHQLFGESVDDAGSLKRLTVVYLSYATSEATGIPASPKDGGPWLMFPGKPTAHVMISGG